MKRLSLLITIGLASVSHAAELGPEFYGIVPSLPPSATAPIVPALNAAPEAALPQTLRTLFAHLDTEHPLPANSPTAKIRTRVRKQIMAAAREFAEPEAGLLETVAKESDLALTRVQQRLDAREIDPNRRIRLSAGKPKLPASGQPTMRIGVYPTAADPISWGHLLIGLHATGELALDKVVFVIAGDDPRKPSMTPARIRHPAALKALTLFAPFFDYSPIAVGTALDGETNIFRILALNPARRIDAWYMVGSDHYRLVDKNGNPDTLSKLEKNLVEPLGHTTLHTIGAAFFERGDLSETVLTSLEVRFFPNVDFEGSSTQARQGRHSLIPYATYRYARENGLYGLEK